MTITRSKAPAMQDVEFLDLFKRTEYPVETEDGWILKIVRYRPVKQPFHQPVFMRPIILVHGFSQNRHAWTSGSFIKNMLYLGADLHIAELRGHGKSSVALQYKLNQTEGRPLPHDIDYAWDLDSYFLYDLPAVIGEVKKITNRQRVYFCGHSLGGMLGYGLAALTDDLAGLITIGSPAVIGSGFLLLRLAGFLGLGLWPAIDGLLAMLNAERKGRYYAEKAYDWVAKPFKTTDSENKKSKQKPRKLKFTYVPTDTALKMADRALSQTWIDKFVDGFPMMGQALWNPQRTQIRDVRWLLREGAEKETRACFEQFARWIRDGRLVCYRANYDFTDNFDKINIPLAIIFGDKDPVGNLKSTSYAYRGTNSNFLLWRPVRGNSHLELTMGKDIDQICYDIKNLIEFAEKNPAAARDPELPSLGQLR